MSKKAKKRNAPNGAGGKDKVAEDVSLCAAFSGAGDTEGYEDVPISTAFSSAGDIGDRAPNDAGGKRSGEDYVTTGAASSGAGGIAKKSSQDAGVTARTSQVSLLVMQTRLRTAKRGLERILPMTRRVETRLTYKS